MISSPFYENDHESFDHFLEDEESLLERFLRFLAERSLVRSLFLPLSSSLGALPLSGTSSASLGIGPYTGDASLTASIGDGSCTQEGGLTVLVSAKS